MIEKLRDTVKNDGVVDTKEMQTLLSNYVRTNMFDRDSAPPSTNKRFFPEHRTIYNYIYATLSDEL